MMNDKELLERAAKAAGMEGYRYCEAWKGMAKYTPQDGFFGAAWRPLTDDGDALRLAVKLGIDVEFCYADGVGQVHTGQSLQEMIAESFSDDAHGHNQCAATRRAIVRAAAAMAE